MTILDTIGACPPPGALPPAAVPTPAPIRRPFPGLRPLPVLPWCRPLTPSAPGPARANKACRDRSGLRFAAHPHELVYLLRLPEWCGLGPPARARHYAGLHQFQPVEEPGELRRRAVPPWRLAVLVPVPDRPRHLFPGHFEG